MFNILGKIKGVVAGIIAFALLFLSYRIKSEQVKNIRKDLDEQKRKTVQAELTSTVKTKVSKTIIDSEKVEQDEIKNSVDNAKHRRGYFTE